VGVRVRRAPEDDGLIARLPARFAETRAAWRTDNEVVEGTRRVLVAALHTPSPRAALLIAENDAGPAGFVYVVTEDDFSRVNHTPTFPKSPSPRTDAASERR
jgi:hypothetical protein